jgi:hypothetical protein
VIGVVAVIAQEKDIFLICTATNDTAPPCFIVLFLLRRDIFIVCDCLDFIGHGIRA